jgi:hypothetical protein
MRFKKVDTTGNHPRFVMHMGKEEAEILQSLLTYCRTHTPKTRETETLLARCRQMERAIRETVQDLKIKKWQPTK